MWWYWLLKGAIWPFMIVEPLRIGWRLFIHMVLR